MKIMGLQKLTLLDYPEHLACTIFLGGCNFSCPFCHNRDLVNVDPQAPTVDEDDFFSLLKKRQGILEGVCISGGEPLLHADLPVLIKKIKALGYLVKLDTNGSYPERLEQLVNQKLVDYVAMDIKNAPDRYAMTAGLKELDLAPIQKSIAFLKQGVVPYEFRTTLVAEFHDIEAIEAIASWLEGDSPYYLQCFEDRDTVIQQGLHAPTREDILLFQKRLQTKIPHTYLRGL